MKENCNRANDKSPGETTHCKRDNTYPNRADCTVDRIGNEFGRIGNNCIREQNHTKRVNDPFIRETNNICVICDKKICVIYDKKK